MATIRTNRAKASKLNTQISQKNAQQVLPWFISIAIFVAIISIIPIYNIQYKQKNTAVAKEIQILRTAIEQKSTELKNLDARLERLKNASLKKYAPEYGLQKAEAVQIVKLTTHSSQDDQQFAVLDNNQDSQYINSTASNF